MNETCTKCGGFTGDFTWSGDFSSAPICKCNNLMPPHQSEKEILESISLVNGMHIYAGKEHYSRELDPEKLASFLYKLESRLDDLQRKVEEDSKGK